MHVSGRKSSRYGLLAALLAAALLATAISQETSDAQQQEQEQQPDIAEVTPYKLTQIPGCEVAEGDGYELPAGLFQNCSISMSPLQQNDPQLFIFTVPDNVQMSAVFTLAVKGGQASISIWYPGTPLNSPPDLVQSELFSSDASSEGWISIPQEDLATHPGDYFISVSSFSGAPAVTLSVNTPPSSLQLVAEERDVLAAVAKHCCKGDEGMKDSPFCAAIAKKSLVPKHSWFEDMCHIAPSSCNPQGQLIELALPGMGLNCGKLPAELGQLTALTRLDLSGNNLASATLDDVAKVISGMPDLEELALSSTGISGELSCDLLTPKMKVADLAHNFIEGSLPSCIISNLTELYLPGNALSGVLPVPTAGSPLTTLYADLQRGGGMTGTIPVAFGSLRRLQYFNLAGNSLSGALPGMPRTVKLFNISANNLSGRIGSLPAGMWSVDVSGNGMTGALPALAGLSSLEVFVANSNNFEGQIPALPSNLQHFEASGSGLSGPLPALPASIRRFDVADNQLTGSVAALDLTKMEVFRASNNSLTGGVPASAAVSPGLFLLDLHSNRLTGSVPDDWSAPRMQMIMLEDNALTGTVPASLAALPRLGVLRLGSNKLSGNLDAFATQLTQLPAAASGSARFSNLFDFNVSSNHLTGAVPDSLKLLGVFNPNITIIVPGDNGGPSIAPRVLDLSDNKFEGAWPTWLLDAVPATASICHCSLFIALDGPDMRLTCPAADITVSDYAWQLAAEQRYKCWNSKDSVTAQLLDQLTSAANGKDKIDTTSMARGDGGNYPFTKMTADPKIIAGVVVGVVAGLTLLSVLGYFVVYKRVIRPQVKATAFSKFEDDPVAAAAAGSIGLTGAGAIGGVAPHDTAAAAAARPM